VYYGEFPRRKGVVGAKGIEPVTACINNSMLYDDVAAINSLAGKDDIKFKCDSCDIVYLRQKRSKIRSLRLNNFDVKTFCSKTCQSSYHTKHAMTEYTCVQCSGKFIKSSGTRPTPKFCSQSCAATYNNALYPRKEGPDNTCDICNVLLGKKWKNPGRFCTSCRVVYKNRNSVHKKPIQECTLEEYINRYSTKLQTNKYTGIRAHAHTVVSKSGIEKICSICKYSKHVELCHIKGISQHEPPDKISDINAVTNLVYLCPNCHWELDHGMLQLI
jgi:hypothetical protein